MQDAESAEASTPDESDGLDGVLDELDAAPVSDGAARRRRGRSRPRIKRVDSAPRASKVSQSEAEQSALHVRSVAESVARQVNGHNHDNLDLECRVAGVTHRGGFKLRVVRLEEVTSTMVDRWRALCLTRGYASTISFDVAASEARIVATPILKTPGLSTCCTGWCTKMDPLNALFVGALALNTLRHALDHFA